MALASVTIDASALSRAAATLGRQGARIARDLDLLVRHRLADATQDFKAHTPRSVPQPGQPPHAHMQDLWQSSMFGEAAGGVFNPAPYTEFLYEGTAPHEIRPAQAQALHFFAAGTEVFTQAVQHPGTQPSAPLLDALARQVDAAEADLGAFGVAVTTDIAARISLP